MLNFMLLCKFSPVVSKLWYSIQLNNSLEFAYYLFHRTSDSLIPKQTSKVTWKILSSVAKDKVKSNKKGGFLFWPMLSRSWSELQVITDSACKAALYKTVPFSTTSNCIFIRIVTEYQKPEVPTPFQKDFSFPYRYLNGAIPFNKKQVHLVLKHWNKVLNWSLCQSVIFWEQNGLFLTRRQCHAPWHLLSSCAMCRGTI